LPCERNSVLARPGTGWEASATPELQSETSAKSHFAILSVDNTPVITYSYDTELQSKDNYLSF